MSRRIENLEAALAEAHENAANATDPFDAAGYRSEAMALATALDQDRITQPFSEHTLAFDANEA